MSILGNSFGYGTALYMFRAFGCDYTCGICICICDGVEFGGTKELDIGYVRGLYYIEQTLRNVSRTGRGILIAMA